MLLLKKTFDITFLVLGLDHEDCLLVFRVDLNAKLAIYNNAMLLKLKNKLKAIN